MKYFVPEWNDRVDPEYDFTSDSHSPGHKQDSTRNDVYMWEIFGINKAPVDGMLVSRIVVENDKRKYKQIIEEGIHKVLRLPQTFEIIGDCGAFGYIDQKVPPFDPVEMLEYYAKVDFNYGVSVDHLVVPQFENDKEERMRITYENGVKTLEEWSRRFRQDFQLLLAVQGWEISDYIKMYRNYIDLGATHLAFGGLARCPTVYVSSLIGQLIGEIRASRKVPQYLHFFGLARAALFPLLNDLEELGVAVGFDSASYLRKAWLSSPSSQLNYLALKGRGYAAIRVPFVTRKTKSKATLAESPNMIGLQNLEQDCLNKLREYDKDKVSIEDVLSTLSRFSRIVGYGPELRSLYKRTLEDKPWRSCECPICKDVGIEVIIFRGNNRNRRRGFHNTYVFHNVLKNPRLWFSFMSKKEEAPILPTMNKGDKVLVITECTKQKTGYNSSTRVPAKVLYKGRLFRSVRAYAEAMGFDYVIISAKYGLLFPDDIIEGYEKVLQTKEDVKNIQPLVEDRLRPILGSYDRIVVIAGEKYRNVLQNLWDDRFIAVKSKGYGDLCSIVEKATPKAEPLLEFVT